MPKVNASIGKKWGAGIVAGIGLVSGVLGIIQYFSDNRGARSAPILNGGEAVIENQQVEIREIKRLLKRLDHKLNQLPTNHEGIGSAPSEVEDLAKSIMMHMIS